VAITRDGVCLRCTCLDELTAERLFRDRDVGQHLTDRIDRTSFRFDPGQRGVLKQALVTAGFPAEDLAGYEAGEALEITLRECVASGAAFGVREYQRQ
jgi:DNA excision repair protein ERCC-3